MRFSTTLNSTSSSPGIMAAATRDLHPLPLPLLIFCLFFISGCSSLPTTAGAAGKEIRGLRRPRSETRVFTTEDYDNLEYRVTPSPPGKNVSPNRGGQKCAYDSCLEGQISCAKLAASTGCLCPGFTLHDVAPEAPRLVSVSWNGSDVVVQWCAPYSYVTAYTVTVGGEERKQFGKELRSGALGDIENISEVCVLAVNDSGASAASCSMYRPVDRGLPVRAGIIAGGVGFLLLLLLLVFIYRRRRATGHRR